MKRYKGFTASPGLVLGQVSRLERPPLVFGEGPFHPEQEKQALEDAIQLAQKELNDMADRAAPTEQAIFLFQSMIATGIIILLSSICTWFVTRRALTPLRRFSDRIRQVQAQNLSEPLEVPLSEDEISRLTRSFNDMLARLDNAFSAQKRFVASAAHELRTPLAVMQTNLEVFYKKPEHAPQEYDRLFTMLQEQTGRLSHLAEILLDMTGLQTVERSDTISLAALTEEVFCDLDPVAEKHQVRLIQTDGDCTVTGSYILLYRAVYNLVENAIKYTPDGGHVWVKTWRDGRNACVEVRDTGEGIAKEECSLRTVLSRLQIAGARDGRHRAGVVYRADDGTFAPWAH